MAKKKVTDGTLFMALEAGADWPARLRGLKSSEANFQAVVQAKGETAEHFAGRTLERWYRLLDSCTPPYRFMLGTNRSLDDTAVAARKRIAHGVFDSNKRTGANQLILWSGASGAEEQGRLLELAGLLLESHGGSERSVKVLLGDPNPCTATRGGERRTVTEQPACLNP
jgi:hypothetical protein